MMKKMFSFMHRPAKVAFIAGWIITLLMLIVSAVLYIGAGRVFDYYIATDISEKLLMLTRPAAIAVSAISLSLEYFFGKRKNISD